MQAAVAVSYFHRKIGPMVFYSYPEEALKEEEKARLADIMDQAFDEGFFTHKFGQLTSMNYYFEIKSEWARGKKEMLMISVIMDSNPNPSVESVILSWCKDFAAKLKETPGIYTAFYNIEDAQMENINPQQMKNYQNDLRFWTKELYWMAIEELREKTEEEIWASVMSEPQIFKVIKKLSKGPIALEDLNKWFNTVFPQYNFNEISKRLEEEKFTFINTIGQDTYVLLVKDVEITRVPPNAVIDLEEDSPELADLTTIYINEVRDFFEFHKPNPLDSLELFKLFADPKIYNVISQLREGPLPKEKILSMVSQRAIDSLLESLELLVQKQIIQEFSYQGQRLFLLKTDVILTASFPQYLKQLLPKESKGYVLQAYTPKPLPEELTHNSDTSDQEDTTLPEKTEDVIENPPEEKSEDVAVDSDIVESPHENQKRISEQFKSLIGDKE